jgi:hypothetical protein
MEANVKGAGITLHKWGLSNSIQLYVAVATELLYPNLKLPSLLQPKINHS